MAAYINMPHWWRSGMVMVGSEARRLRKAGGMSQAEFGVAIGVSRETMSRIERSTEPLDRRTELAIRYVAEGRAARVPALSEIHEAVAQMLDQTSVRGQPPYDYGDRMKSAFANWRARQGNPEVEPMFRRAEGVMGMLNVTPPSDRLRDRTIQDLLDMKRDWRSVTPVE